MTSPFAPNPTSLPSSQPSRYRAVSAGAVVSLVVAILSVFAILHVAFLFVPMLAILIGHAALRRIRRVPEELSGAGLAWGGIVTAVVLGGVAVGVFLFARATEFPFGYQRVDYESLQPDLSNPDELIPEAAYEYVFDPSLGNKVGIEGYMYPGRQSTGLKNFLLCPAIPNCPMCAPNPLPTQIIHVKLEGDLSAYYTEHLIRVGGKFRVDEMSRDGVPYFLDADFLVQPR